MKKVISSLILSFFIVAAFAQDITFTELQNKGPGHEGGQYGDIDIDITDVDNLWVSPEQYGSGRFIHYIPADKSYLATTYPLWFQWKKEEIEFLDENHFKRVGDDDETFYIRPDGKLEIFWSEGGSEILDPVSF